MLKKFDDFNLVWIMLQAIVEAAFSCSFFYFIQTDLLNFKQAEKLGKISDQLQDIYRLIVAYFKFMHIVTFQIR